MCAWRMHACVRPSMSAHERVCISLFEASLVHVCVCVYSMCAGVQGIRRGFWQQAGLSQQCAQVCAQLPHIHQCVAAWVVECNLFCRTASVHSTLYWHAEASREAARLCVTAMCMHEIVLPLAFLSSVARTSTLGVRPTCICIGRLAACAVKIEEGRCMLKYMCGRISCMPIRVCVCAQMHMRVARAFSHGQDPMLGH